MTAHGRRRQGSSPVILVIMAAVLASSPALAQDAGVTHGPPNGALVIVGGGGLGPEIREKFIELAGGADARIVVLPGAGTRDSFPDDWSGLRQWQQAGAANVAVLHTRDPQEADSEAFVAPLRNATGVWIPGGRQWRLTDAYNGTRTLRELHAVLERGGVIGGSSAGASVQASYMVRGAPEGNAIMMAPGHVEGFGFLVGAAVDQHILARGRQNDLREVMAAHPELLGIGIDESTAIVVQGNRAAVIGASMVAFHNTSDRGDLPYYFLERGDTFDLTARRVVRGTRLPPVEGDRRMIDLVLDRFLEGIREADTTAIRRVLHDDATLFELRPAGQSSRVRSIPFPEYFTELAGADQRFDRRIETPVIRVDGNLASVWGRSVLYQGDSVVSCGSDAIQLGRSGQSGWRIIHIAFTESPCSD